MLFNFTSGQIRQVYSDSRYNTCVREDTDLDAILNDLGYTANDLMNVSFVFIVEGKQDKSRLPLLLKKYYSEVYDCLLYTSAAVSHPALRPMISTIVIVG